MTQAEAGEGNLIWPAPESPDIPFPTDLICDSVDVDVDAARLCAGEATGHLPQCDHRSRLHLHGTYLAQTCRLPGENQVRSTQISTRREAGRIEDLASVTTQLHISEMDRLLRSGPEAICFTVL